MNPTFYSNTLSINYYDLRGNKSGFMLITGIINGLIVMMN